MPRFAAQFFFDAGSGFCLWADNDETRAKFDDAIEHDELPVTRALADEMTRLAQWYDTSLNWDYPPDPGPWREAECESFNLAVVAVLGRLRDELGPEWQIDDQYTPIHEDPDLDRYLIDPRNFRRTKAE